MNMQAKLLDGYREWLKFQFELAREDVNRFSRIVCFEPQYEQARGRMRAFAQALIAFDGVLINKPRRRGITFWERLVKWGRRNGRTAERIGSAGADSKVGVVELPMGSLQVRINPEEWRGVYGSRGD